MQNEDVICEILDRLTRHTAALSFVTDHTEDHRTKQTLRTIEDDMVKTTEMLGNLKG